MSRRPFRRDRWLTLLEVADLLKLPHHGKAERRRVTRRLVRRLELRDGARYMRAHGSGRTSRLYVSIAALEQLTPWDAGTLTAMRQDIDGLGTRMKRAERRIDGHDRDILRNRLIAEKTADYARFLGEQLSQTEPQLSQKRQLSKGTHDARVRG
jgi:hypothetical protein